MAAGAARAVPITAEWAALLGSGGRGVKRAELEGRAPWEAQASDKRCMVVRVIVGTGVHGGMPEQERTGSESAEASGTSEVRGEGPPVGAEQARAAWPAAPQATATGREDAPTGAEQGREVWPGAPEPAAAGREETSANPARARAAQPAAGWPAAEGRVEEPAGTSQVRAAWPAAPWPAVARGEVTPAGAPQARTAGSVAPGPAVTRGRGQLEGAAQTATVKAEWAKLLGRGGRGVKRTEPDGRDEKVSSKRRVVRVVMGTGMYGGGSQRGQEGSEQESVQIDDEGTETAGDRGLAPPPAPPSASAGVPVGGSRFARCAFRTGPVRFRPALAPRGDLLIAAAGLD